MNERIRMRLTILLQIFLILAICKLFQSFQFGHFGFRTKLWKGSLSEKETSSSSGTRLFAQEGFSLKDFGFGDDDLDPTDPNFKIDFGADFDNDPDLYPTIKTNHKNQKFTEQFGSNYLPMIQYMKKLGFSDEQLNVIVHVCPDVFKLNTVDSLQEKIKFLEERFYLKGKTLVIFLSHVPFLLNRNIEGFESFLQESTEFLDTKGLTLKDVEKEDISDWESWPPPKTPPEYIERI